MGIHKGSERKMATFYVLWALLLVGFVKDGAAQRRKSLFEANLEAGSKSGLPNGLFTTEDDEPKSDSESVFGVEDPTPPKLFQADIIYDDAVAEIANGQARVYEAEVNKRWRNRYVPYYIKKGYKERELTLLMGKAVAMYNKQLDGCITWEKFDSVRDIQRAGHRNWISVQYKIGCYSNVGSVGREQVISLGAGCHYVGTAMHEMMHALGFWHEQMRKDRDMYIQIKWENIMQGMAFNFKTKHFTSTMGEPYDILSLMHYPPTAFSRNRQPTIVHRQGVKDFGFKDELSKIDVIQLKKMYVCDGVKKGGAECKDVNEQCPTFAKEGECRNNAGWMMINCKKSCNNCPKPKPPPKPKCKDKDSRCSGWKSFCENPRYKSYMEDKCCETCSKDQGPAPINGGFSEWSDWTACTKKCGGGIKSRRRACTNPAPEHGGKDCSGAQKESQRCNTQKCVQATCLKDKGSFCRGHEKNCKTGRFQKWMRKNCCVTCGLKKGPAGDSKKICIKDKHSRCKTYKRQNFCTKYKSWMKKKCYTTCGYCK